MTTIDHAAKARRYIESAHRLPLDVKAASLALAEAQVHATLALAVERRTANLISYVAKWTDDELLDVDAEIRKALGL